MRTITAIFSSWYFRWLIIGILIRLILAAITLHPDLWAFSFTGKIFVEEGVLNIYDYLHKLPLNSSYLVYGTDFFTYPPLAYFVLGTFRFLMQPLFDPNFYQQLFVNFSQPFLISGIFRHNLLVKLPYLVFDLAILWLLPKFFTNDVQKKKVFLLWVFNPVSWYASFMIGQFDVIPTFFILFSLWFALKSQNNLALFSLGLGGAFKVFPLLLVPFAVAILAKTFAQRLKLLLIGLAPFIFTVTPFLASEAFRSVVIFGTQSQKLLYAGINVSGADVIYLFPVLYLLLLFYVFNFPPKVGNLWQVFLAAFLVLFSLTNYHPQWFIWITPFLVIWIVYQPEKWFYPILLFIIFAGIVLLFEPSLSIGLFSPIAPFLTKTPSLSLLIERFIPVHQVASLLRSIFAGVSLFMIFLIFNQDVGWKRSFNEK